MRRRVWPPAFDSPPDPSGGPPADRDQLTEEEAQRVVLFGRAAVALGGVLAIYAAVVFKVGWLQIVKRAELEQISHQLLHRSYEEPGKPGDILDRFGRVLATSVEVYDVKIDPWLFRKNTTLEKRREAVPVLAHVLGVPAQEIWEKVNSDRGYEYLATGVSPKVKGRVEAAKKEHRIPWVTFDVRYRREYPMGKAACYVLGWRGPNHAPRCGLEQTYDFLLTGIRGSKVLNIDKYGRLVPWDSGKRAMPARPAKSIVLTIDADLQQATETALVHLWKRFRPKRCLAVVMEPKTGAVLAMAALPGYDPNWFSGSAQSQWRKKDKPLDNPVVNWGFEPGSVMKAFTVAAALELGITNEREVFHCEGKIPNLGGKPLSCAGGTAHGTLNLVMAVARSCNLTAARLAMRIGGPTLVAWLKRFGFGHPTRVGIRPEGFGLLPPGPGQERLRQRDVANLGFGQGMSATLIQLAAAYCGLLNDGKYMLPYVVKEVVRRDGEVFRRVEPKMVRQVCSPETSRRIRRMLRMVVQKGTGKDARIPGVDVGGKTGTAQKPKPGGGYWGRERPEKHIAVFVLAVPIEEPELVIAVAADEPKGRYHGGDVAAPTAREIAVEALRLRGELPAVAEGGEARPERRSG